MGIRETLSNPDNEDFWWLNNGVTITTSNATIANGSLVIEDPQIVNGLQSSHELFNHFNSGGQRDDQRKILVRVIKPSDEKSRLKIIKATNSQTGVPIASLRATDEIHLNIEDYFLANGFFYDRRKNYYKNNGKAPDLIISIPYLSQIVTAIVLREPNNSRARPSTLIKNDSEYVRIFDSSYDVEIYLWAVLIHKRIEQALRNYNPALQINTISNIKFHVTMYVVSTKLHKLTYGANEIRRIDIDSISSQEISRCIAIVLEEYTRLGETDKISKSEEFVTVLKERIANENAFYIEGLRTRTNTAALSSEIGVSLEPSDSQRSLF
jgi:hypothetical protein